MKKSKVILFIISGCNSGWYLPHLKNDMTVKNPKEIGKDQYDRNQQISKWVSTMFSFLFGDGVAAFVMTKTNANENNITIKKKIEDKELHNKETENEKTGWWS